MFVLKRNQIIITALIIMIAVAGYLNYQDSKSSKQNGIALTDSGEVAAMAPTSVSDNSSDIGVALTYNENDNPAIATDSTAAGVSGNSTTGAQLAANTQASDNSASGTANGSANSAANSSTDSTVGSVGSGANTAGNSTTDSSQVNGSSSEDDPGQSVFVYGSTESSYFIQAKFDREQAYSKEKSVLMDVINNANLNQDKKAEAADSMIDIQKRIEKESAAEAMIEAKGFGDAYVRIDDNSVDVVVSKAALTDAEIAQISDIVKRKTGMTEDQIHISPMRQQ